MCNKRRNSASSQRRVLPLADDNSATGKRILIVDDEPDILRGVGMWLKAAGYQTSCARDGEQALQATLDEQPDAIVMDVRMPGKDGITVMNELKRRDNSRRTPIVMLSASLVDQDKALDAGATCFLTKPYEGRELVAAIKAAIEK